jgi:hypothetical protein
MNWVWHLLKITGKLWNLLLFLALTQSKLQVTSAEQQKQLTIKNP